MSIKIKVFYSDTYYRSKKIYKLYKIFGAYLDSGKYLYAVYDNANDKKDYKLDFAANFSSDVCQLIKKGDIEAAVFAETDNYKGTVSKQTGVANLRFYSNKSNIQKQYNSR